MVVTPCMGVWIETSDGDDSWRIPMSHPVWVCGLKLESTPGVIKQRRSHPVWVCGLKHVLPASTLPPRLVTPCMGVWIETP